MIFIHILEMLVVCIVLAQQIFNDGYAAVYLILLRAHMHILLLRVRKLSKQKDITTKDKTKALKLCVQDYQLLLE